MNILITGVTGRIGANVARRLLDRGHAIRGLVWEGDRRADKLAALGVAVLDGDLNSSTDISTAVRGQDAIIHLGAAFQAGGPFTPEQYFDTNVKGTFNVVEAARGLGDCPRRSFGSRWCGARARCSTGRSFASSTFWRGFGRVRTPTAAPPSSV